MCSYFQHSRNPQMCRLGNCPRPAYSLGHALVWLLPAFLLLLSETAIETVCQSPCPSKMTHGTCQHHRHAAAVERTSPAWLWARGNDLCHYKPSQAKRPQHSPAVARATATRAQVALTSSTTAAHARQSIVLGAPQLLRRQPLALLLGRRCSPESCPTWQEMVAQNSAALFQCAMCSTLCAERLVFLCLIWRIAL
jgi:hypothetical protein